nr:reverse transcriptase domain-containing protein [Tanacetum cinerariifolium]
MVSYKGDLFKHLLVQEVPIAPADPVGALEVGAVAVISPTGVLDLVDYSSSSDSGPSEDSLPVAPELPLVLPCVCSDDSEEDSESKPAKQRSERHESLTPSSEFPLAPVVASTGIHRHSSPDFTSDSSFSSSSSDSSSDIFSGSSLNSLSDSSSVHSSSQSHIRPSTRVASPRLVDPSVRTPRCSEAFMHWRSAPLSTLYPPTTLESSPDSSSERSLDSSLSSARPSHKRYKSPATLVPLSTPVLRSIAHALADLSPHKRFRDSYSSEVNEEEHMEMVIADAETVVDLGINEGVGAYIEDGIDLGIKVTTSDIREDDEEFEVEASARGTMEIDVDPLEEMLLILRVFFMIYLITFLRTMPITRSGMTLEAIKEPVNKRVKEALAAYEATRAANALEAENVSYVVKLADGIISEPNTVLRGCTLGLLGHPFNIDLMLVELGSFDVIISMDWLANHHTVIVCDEKIVRIPYGEEVLIVQGDKNSKGIKSKWSIISYTKTQKYIKKCCLIFLAQVMRKETEDKSEEKRLEDVPTV